MSSLTEFLLARLAEDEAVARRGISSQADPENGWGYKNGALTPHVGIIHEAVQAEHITRWHPARVLADVEAKRAVVKLHESLSLDGGSKLFDRVMLPSLQRVTDEVLRLLAQPYADHPDFDPAWA